MEQWNKYCRILEGIKGKDLRKLTSTATEEFKTCYGAKKILRELIIDAFQLKCSKQTKSY